MAAGDGARVRADSAVRLYAMDAASGLAEGLRIDFSITPPSMKQSQANTDWSTSRTTGNASISLARTAIPSCSAAW